MSDSDIPADLQAILDEALPQLAPGGGLMPTLPSPDFSADERRAWEGEVALLRARHDASALQAGILYDDISRRELGDDPLGVRGPVVTPSWAEVEVPTGRIGLRVYRPGGDGPFPVIVLVHGGAYWVGGGAAGWQLNDALCRKLCGGVGAVIVNVDHRLAPEHPCPAPVDDVSAALVWVSQHAEDLDADASRLATFGISSGGNLTAVTAHRGADGLLPALRAQVLQCPSLDLSLSSSRFSDDENEGARRLIAMYARDARYY